MRYSTWHNSRWEVFEKPGPSISIDYLIDFTLGELTNNLNDCLNIVMNQYGGNISPEELEELVGYLREFMLDHQS